MRKEEWYAITWYDGDKIGNPGPIFDYVGLLNFLRGVFDANHTKLNYISIHRVRTEEPMRPMRDKKVKGKMVSPRPITGNSARTRNRTKESR